MIQILTLGGRNLILFPSNFYFSLILKKIKLGN
jgi:hypothetical protein